MQIWLREWRHVRGLTLEQLAARVGTDKTQLSRLEKGKRRLTMDWLERIAPALGCEPVDLLGPPPSDLPGAGLGRRVRPQHATVQPGVRPNTIDYGGESYAAIPVYNVQADAGHGALVAAEEEKHRILFRGAWLNTVTNAALDQLAVIQVDGDSMEPTLRSGDTALIDLSQTRPGRKDGLYVLLRDDGLLVKRVALSWKTGLAIIKSDNPAYPSESDVDPATLDVRGRVIWIGRRI
jgi:phage repressor protein C with HTH and peptisase S24 domain